MKKIFTFIAALTLSIGLFAEDAISAWQKRSLWQGTLPISWYSEGRIDIAASGFEEVPAGAELVLCYTQVDQTWGQAQICFGDWLPFKNITNPDGTVITKNEGSLVPTEIYGWFIDGILYRETPIVLSEQILADMRDHVDYDGNILHIQGSDLIFNEIYIRPASSLEEVDMKPFITYEQPNPVFDYPYYPDWTENTGKLRIYRDNGLQDLNLEAGVSKIIFYKTAGTTGQIQINDPNWVNLETVADWVGDATTLEYVLTEDAFKCVNGDIVDGWSETAFVLQGDGLEVTKIAIVTGTGSLPFDRQFVDAQSGLTFWITDFGEVNNVMVVSNNNESHTYSGDIIIPSTVNYQDVTFMVTQIGGRAFYGCSNLTSITIPNSVTTIGYNAFYGCTGLTSIIVEFNNTVYDSRENCNAIIKTATNTLIFGCKNTIIPNSVTTIGSGAFSGCSSLTSVTIPNSVTTIGIYAFSDCSGLTSITIPESVTTIGYGAFYGCSGLTSITIPNSVTTIGSSAFYGCTSLPVINNLRYADTYLVEAVDKTLSTYTIKTGTKWIGNGAFQSCTSLKSITIPESVTTIKSASFERCSSLTSITIPNSVIEIEGWGVFSNCTSLESVIIGDSVKTIGNGTFNGCSRLTSITIPNSVTTIEAQAFSWSGLKDVSVNWTSRNQLPTMESDVFIGIANYTGPSAATLHIPEGTKHIYENADQWKNFGTITESQQDLKNNIITYTATEKLQETTEIYVEGLHTNSFNVAITSHDFSNGIGTITFAGEITTIGYNAFYGCSGLTSITIPSSITTIGGRAFSVCDGLISINVDAANKHYRSIEGILFSYAKDTLIRYPAGNTQTEYSIPNSVTTIGSDAFSGCSGLTSVTIPNSVTTIGDWAFEGCSGLTSITIPNSVISIGYRAFYGCTSLPIISNLRYADTYLIEAVDKTLSTYTIQDGIKWIGDQAFSDCTGLTSITIPSSVTTIGDMAFTRCSHLESATIPNSVITIGHSAFAYCNSLTSISIPNSVTTIGIQAFYFCDGLTSITIPYSVIEIEHEAFSHCFNLTSVTILWTDALELPTMGNDVFSFIANRHGPSSATLHVPSGTKSIYQVADVWKDFGTIIADQQDTKNCVITYTATEKLLEALDEWSGGLYINGFNVAITSHEFSNGTGTITFAGEVTTIGESAFYLCSGLTSVTIPNSVTTIGEWAFSGCTGLTSITIPNSVTTIGSHTFYGCSGLTSITIPNSVTTIGISAFSNCSGLTSVTIPNSVTTIGDEAFYECSGLSSVTIPNSVTTIGSAAFFASGLTSVTIPNSVTTIGDHAFAYCYSLTSVTIGNSVTTIGDYAFQPHPNNIDSPILTSIRCFAVNPPSCDFHTFYSIRQDTKVYVLASSLSAYQSADVWKDLNLLPLGADETPIEGDEPIITPTDLDVTIIWPITDGTDSYTLTISKNGETVCVLTFNANGQLTNIAFATPGHNGARQAPAATLTEQGYQFTVIGLDPGTDYDYSVTATDAEGKTLAEYKGNFSTTGGTGFESVHDAQCTPKGLMHKVFRNGQLFIESSDATYTSMGQKVK